MTSTPVDPNVSNAITVAHDYDALCGRVADRIAALVRCKPNAVLGLATGSTPLGVYDRLARLHQIEDLDFSRVICFNLDEYHPMAPESIHSYHHFMDRQLFRRINCTEWFVPDGRPRSLDRVARDCREYEARIASAGGIDLQLLGIGRSGHIGFNEPGSANDSRTRLVALHALTVQDAAASFDGLESVPRLAVTMGVGTILEAREIIVIASGSAKAEIVRAAWMEDVTEDVPASLVRSHPNARLHLDKTAASLLS